MSNHIKKSLVSTIILIFTAHIVWAQSSKLFSFEILGTVNSDTGLVLLQGVAGEEYYSETIEYSSKVKDGKFVIQGKIHQPSGYKISFNDQYLSDMFIIAPGSQTIHINLDSNAKMPKISNSVMREYTKYYDTFRDLRTLKDASDKRHSALRKTYPDGFPDSIRLEVENFIQSSYRENDRLLLKYASENPKSNIVLWRLVQLNVFGYEKILDSIFDVLDETLKRSPAGIALAKNLSIGRSTQIGARFPTISLIDTVGLKVKPFVYSQNYTLIDFWYSNCAPCIAQFEHLNQIHKKFGNTKFRIIGISTDKARQRADWKNAIVKHHLSWDQYWDVDGIGAKVLGIMAFPTNFLVDKDGIIIEKNIKPAQLEKFLETKLTSSDAKDL